MTTRRYYRAARKPIGAMSERELTAEFERVAALVPFTRCLFDDSRIRKIVRARDRILAKRGRV